MFRDVSQQAVIDFIASQVGQDVVDQVLAAASEAEAQVYGH
jgi:hypothetical protein